MYVPRGAVRARRRRRPNGRLPACGASARAFGGGVPGHLGRVAAGAGV